MRNRVDSRYPFVEWVCFALEAALDGGQVAQPRPDSFELAPIDVETLMLIEQALDKLPPIFSKNAHVFSMKETLSVNQDVSTASLEEAVRLASQARHSAGQTGWSDAALLCEFLTRIQAIVSAQRCIAKPPRSILPDWAEDAEDWLRQIERAHGSQGSESAGFCDALKSLLDICRTLELERTARNLERTLLPLCEDAMVLATRRRQWNEASKHRGQYLSCWNNVQNREVPNTEEHRSSKPTHLWADIGATLAAMHARPQDLSSLRDYERKHRESSGGCDDDGLVQFTSFPSPAGIQLDMEILYRGTTPEEWNHFIEAYVNVAEIAEPVKGMITGCPTAEKGRRPDEHYGVDERLPQPSFAVRLCTHALRTCENVKIDFAGRLKTIQEANSLEGNCFEAAELLLESTGIDDEVASAALWVFYEGVQALHNAGEDRSVIALIERGLARVANIIDTEPQQLLSAFGYLSRANLERDAEQAAPWLIRAGLSLVGSGRPDALNQATRAFYRALCSTSVRDTYARAAVELVLAMMRQAVLSRQAPPLEPVLRMIQEGIDGDALNTKESAIIAACKHAVEAWLTQDPERRVSLMQTAIQCAEGFEELRDLQHVFLASIDRTAEPRDTWEDPEWLILDELSADTRNALANEDWPLLVDLARRDVERCKGRNLQPDTLRLQVALLARGLRKLGEVDDTRRVDCATQVQDLMDVYAGSFLAVSDALDEKARVRWAANASDLGFAAVRLSRFMSTGHASVLELAVELLRRSIMYCSPTTHPVEHATYLHDLAHAYQQSASRCGAADKTAFLQKSCALFRESLVLHRELRRRSRFAAAMAQRPECVDYCNLGGLYLELAHEYASGSDDVFGFPASALCYRAAFCLSATGRDIALNERRGQDAILEHLRLAQIGLELSMACLNHTRATKGTLRREFHDWLCAIEGPVISTWDFAQRYAWHALRSARNATIIALSLGDGSLLGSCARTILAIWSLAETRHGVSGGPILFADNRYNLRAFRRDALLTVTELLGTVSKRLDPAGDEVFNKELDEYLRYFHGMLKLELFEQVTQDVEHLSAARDDFAWLSDHGNLISRALVRPLAQWFDVHAGDEGIYVNGLFIGRGAGGLDIRITSQRRSLKLEGVHLDRAYVQLRESSWVKTHCLRAIAYLEPQVSWSDVPPMTPTIVARCKTAQGAFLLVAVRLPTSSWDTWVFHLKRCFEGDLQLSLPFKYVGIFDRAERRFDVDRSAETRNDEDVLLFEGGRIVFEASVKPQRDSVHPLLSVERFPDRAGLSIRSQQAVFSLRTTPRIVQADTATLVKADSIWGAACCVASFPLIAPSVTTPASMMRAFAPLFFFEGDIPLEICGHFRASSCHEVFVIGTSTNFRDLDEALDLLFDPRRELFLLVEPHEVGAVCDGIRRLRKRIEEAMGEPLFRVAASLDDQLDPFDNIQVVEVSRSLAPAAGQILLDLAAFRRFPIEDVSSAIAAVQTGGDPAAMRRAVTRLPKPANWEDLVGKYFELVHKSPFETIRASQGMNHQLERLAQVLTQPIAKRPCFLLPDESATLLAAIPYARHLGAFLLPNSDAGRKFCESLEPSKVYVVGNDSEPERLMTATPLPDGHIELAKRFNALARMDHERRLRELVDINPHAASSLRLHTEMAPSEYVVVASLSGAEPWPSFLAANYAAALGSALLLIDDTVLFENGIRKRQTDLLTGQAWVSCSARSEARDLIAGAAQDLSTLLANESAELDSALKELKPKYVGLVSARVFAPLELMGTPPIGTRYAVGRLAAPDLTTTSLLITDAALGEEASRGPDVLAVITEAADAVPEKPLPGARQEVESLEKLLASSNLFQCERIDGLDDLTRFLGAIENANVIHFAGHGLYDDDDPGQSCLVFREGKLRASNLTTRLRGLPVVFSNACETGVASQVEKAGRGWSGLAASFIASGAVNYVGSLWPVFDASSRWLSERFYSLLYDGYSTGEALRLAKWEAYDSRDPIWAAMVLFGCPRNRLRSVMPDVQ